MTLCVLCVAGFWPFTPYPRNEVHWLDNRNGLYFGEYATVLSDEPLRPEGSPEGPCSVELWMQPGVISDSNTMLAFYIPERLLQFSIEQNGDELTLERKPGRSTSHAKKSAMYISHAFHQDVPVLITVTSGLKGAVLYINGVPVTTDVNFGLSRRDLAGRIVAGNSPFGDDSWSGMLYGIGVYNQILSPGQVRQNYEQWTQSGQPNDLTAKKAVAVFNFSDRRGVVVHNLISGGLNLSIPDHYLVLAPPFLEAFWRPSALSWGFWKDMLLNVCGFVPLGLCFSAYFGRFMPLRRALCLAILFGVTLSFSIEGTQYFLPTRDSDSRDFLNNSLGTILGALMYRLVVVRRIVAWLGVASRVKREPKAMSIDPAVGRDS